MPQDTKTGGVIRVFGGMSVEFDGVPVSIGGARQHRLLALLVINPGSVVTHDWLAEHLWADDERPKETVATLRTYVSRLRRALPDAPHPWIETQTGGYMFVAPAMTVEHRQFESLRARATEARALDDPHSALGFLDQTLALWRGDPFRELEDFDWARAAIEQLRLDRLEVLEERWEVALALGKHTQITGELATFTAEHGLRDRAVRQHALALHRSGRTAEALRAIEAHRRTLADESGLDPSPAMIELETSLIAGDASLEIEQVGRPLRGYRLLEEIGNGAFSVVWRGVQPSVGRDVAIKQIRVELASQPQFIRRFEAEAHLVAAIEHPHVVPLIDFWRDPDSAYLVMRWLRGGTLERRLDDGSLTVAQTMTLMGQIGGALSSSHAHGIVHRDVKPANILFDHEDNAFLTDFGIALEATQTGGPESALSPGSLAYAAPEQIRKERLGPEADVFSFGVVLSECFGSGEIPTPIAQALARATSENPSDRFGSIEEFLEAAVSDPEHAGPASILADNPDSTPTAPPLSINPYKGLRAFDHGDSDVFFGRERLTRELVSRFSATSIASRCIVVVGPSGSGKSSVVRAGLVPAVRAGAIDGSAEWFSSTMVPGADPYESMEAALLRVAINPPSSLLTQLRDGERGILRCLRRCLGTDESRVLLTIDQFEELFTGSAAPHADDFLNALAVAVHDPTSPLRLVITIRADYYDRPLAHATFAPIVKACAVEVTPLAGDELERAIVEPARKAGVEFEPGLVARIAGETLGLPGALPLLQYTLSELFDGRRDEVLTIDEYEGIGGLSGALAARAEAIYAESDDVHRATIRNIFGRMTDPSGEWADIRQRVPLADLDWLPTSASVLERYGGARLVTFDRDVGTREPTVEVAHEALLREWPRLASWLEEDRDVLRSVASVATAANAWDEGGRAESDVYRGWRLEHAVDLVLSEPDRLRALDNEFIDASRISAESANQIEEQRIQRLRRLVAGVGAALVVALLAGGLAVRQSSRADEEAKQADESAAAAQIQARIAEDQTRVAESQTAAAVQSAIEADLATLISRSAAQVNDDPDLAVLLALEAHRRRPSPETDQAVLNALGSGTFANRILSQEPLVDPSEPCSKTQTNGDGTIEFGVLDGQLVSRDPLTGDVVEHGPSPVPCVRWLGDAEANRRVAFADDGQRMWLGPFDGPWDVEREFAFPTFLISRSFNEANRLIADSQSPAAGGAVIVLDDETGDTIGAPLRDGEVLRGAAISESGSLLVASFSFNVRPEGVGLVVVADAATGEELFRFDTELFLDLFAIDEAAGELVAGSSQATSISTFDLETGELVAEVPTRSTANRPQGGISIRSDGMVVSVSTSQIELVDRRTGVVGSPIELRGISSARVRPDGSILTFDADRRVMIVDPASNSLVEQVWPAAPFAEVSFADGRAGIVREPASDPEIIDLATGARSTFELAVNGERVMPPVAQVDGDGYWTPGPDSFLRRWVGDDLVASVNVGGFPFTGNLNGNRNAVLTAGGNNGFIVAKVVDLARLRVVLTIPAPSAASVIPTREGGVHILDVDGRLHTYDSEGLLVGEMAVAAQDFSSFNIAPGQTLGTPIAMDPSTGRLAMAGALGEAVIVDPARGEVEVLPSVDSVQAITFVRGGELLVIVGADGTVSLWDVERGRSAGQVWTGTGAANAGLPWYDETTDVVWVATSGKLISIPLDPAGWVERSCEIVGRDFTQDEWDRFVPGDEPLQSACA